MRETVMALLLTMIIICGGCIETIMDDVLAMLVYMAAFAVIVGCVALVNTDMFKEVRHEIKDH